MKQLLNLFRNLQNLIASYCLIFTEIINKHPLKMSQQMLIGNPLTKSSRSLKETFDKNRSSVTGNTINNSNDSVEIKLPKIKSQKADNFFSESQDPYHFAKNKKLSQPSFSKEKLEGLDARDKVKFDRK
jgi:hypothetical protein